ncbi:hypothetical protein ACFP51_27460 [Streptomyces pratens]|uniref:DUF624 domain-containing protein n=1 Tax=Streptomyces pratens TaxID=887456 RepID=A0ABW1M219_9ACTN
MTEAHTGTRAARRAGRAAPGESPLAGKFALFAECLLTGVWIALASLPLVTYPAAFAAGSRHLGRHLAHERGGLREFAADFRSALRGGWLVGLAGWAALAVVWVDVRAVRAGLPGGELVGAVGVLALIAAAVAGLRAAVSWRPGTSWRSLCAQAARRTVLDPAGSFLIVGGLAVVVCSAWFSAPLALPVLGAVAAAAVAVEERHRHR